MKEYIKTLMEFESPDKIIADLVEGNEDNIKNLINTVVEKRKESKGSEYVKYSKVITILKVSLEQIQTRNAIKTLIRVNKDY